MPLYTFSGTPLAAIARNRDYLIHKDLAPNAAEMYEQYEGFFDDKKGLWTAYVANDAQMDNVRTAWDALVGGIPLQNVLHCYEPLVPGYAKKPVPLPSRHNLRVPAALLLVLPALINELSAKPDVLDKPLPRAEAIFINDEDEPINNPTLGEILGMVSLANIVQPVTDPRFAMVALQPGVIEPADLLLFSAEIATIKPAQCYAAVDGNGIQWHGMPLGAAMDAAAKMVRSLLAREKHVGTGRIF